jgi:hypothetical protein
MSRMVNVQHVHRDELSPLVRQISGALAYVEGVTPSPPPYTEARPQSVTGSGVVITEDGQLLVITCYLHVDIRVVACVTERCVVVQSLIATLAQRTTHRDVVVNVIVTDLLA